MSLYNAPRPALSFENIRNVWIFFFFGKRAKKKSNLKFTLGPTADQIKKDFVLFNIKALPCASSRAKNPCFHFLAARRTIFVCQPLLLIGYRSLYYLCSIQAEATSNFKKIDFSRGGNNRSCRVGL